MKGHEKPGIEDQCEQCVYVSSWCIGKGDCRQQVISRASVRKRGEANGLHATRFLMVFRSYFKQTVDREGVRL